MNKFKNAGIRTRAQAVRLLEEGQVFYFGAGTSLTRIWYAPEYINIGESPYRYGSDGLAGMWDVFEEWNSKVEWFDNIPSKGILCWVTDATTGKWGLANVTSYNPDHEYPFTTDITKYRFAKLATQEEVNNLVYKG